jgi:YVTN family beta-propeller protein
MSLATVVRTALIAIGVALAIGVAWIATLVFPGNPTPAKSLAFDGFIPLPAAPNAGALTILDYLSVSERTLFVTGESTGAVYEVPLGPPASIATAGVRMMPGDPAAHGVVVDPASRLAFVTRSESNRVDVFDPATLRTVKKLPVADDADGIFFDPKNHLVYAVHGDPRLATVIDPKTTATVATIPLGGQPESAAFDLQKGVFYQALRSANAIAVLDLARGAVVDRWPLGQCVEPTSVAIDPADQRLFVVCAKNAELVVVDLGSHRVVAAQPIGGGPDSVAYDPQLRRLYSTGRSGVLVVVQQDSPDRYRTLDLIKLHYGAHTLALDPVTHRVYVGYASLLTPPRVAMFDAVQ